MDAILPSPSVSGVKAYLFFGLKVVGTLILVNQICLWVFGDTVLMLIANPLVTIKGLTDRFKSS